MCIFCGEILILLENTVVNNHKNSHSICVKKNATVSDDVLAWMNYITIVTGRPGLKNTFIPLEDAFIKNEAGYNVPLSVLGFCVSSGCLVQTYYHTSIVYIAQHWHPW